MPDFNSAGAKLSTLTIDEITQHIAAIVDERPEDIIAACVIFATVDGRIAIQGGHEASRLISAACHQALDSEFHRHAEEVNKEDPFTSLLAGFVPDDDKKGS